MRDNLRGLTPFPPRDNLRELTPPPSWSLPRRTAYRIGIGSIRKVQARVITGTSRHSHITPVLKALHWLPIQSRLDFKVLVQTYKALNEQAPGYVRDMLSVYTPSRTLRSQSSQNLVTPRFKSAIYGKRCFSLSAASLWNNLPRHIKESRLIFKRSLKTHLFLAYYNSS